MKRILAIFGLCALAACAQTTASLSPEQCDVDWTSVGLADGAEGAPETKLASYERACARGGGGLAMAETEAWRAGWRRGVEGFCASDPATDDEAARASRRDLCAFEVVSSAPASDRERSRRTTDRGGDIDYGSPTIRPRVGLGVGVGSGGVRVGGGVGVGVGIFDLGLFF